jgi:hypothetical protein
MRCGGGNLGSRVSRKLRRFFPPQPAVGSQPLIFCDFLSCGYVLIFHRMRQAEKVFCTLSILMAKIWKEPLDAKKHKDFMTGFQDRGGRPPEPKDKLVPRWVYFVREGDFTFQFHSFSQIREALEYFQKQTHPTSRVAGVAVEHYWQRWYERLPPGLRARSRRTRIIKALQKALEQFAN